MRDPSLVWEFYNYRREVLLIALRLLPGHWSSMYAQNSAAARELKDACPSVQLVQKCRPNPAHLALSAYEKILTQQDRQFTLITQVTISSVVCSYSHRELAR